MTTVALSIYLLLGFALGIVTDRKLMKQEVPYGEVPAVMPLATMRMICVGTFTLIGLPFLVKIVVGVLRERYSVTR